MSQPTYDSTFSISANTESVSRNKGILIIGTGSAGSAGVEFYDINGETGATETVRVPANSTAILPIRVGAVRTLTNCTIKGLN